VTISFTASGSVSDFTDDVRDIVVSVIAGAAGVDATSIALRVTSASVNIVATISLPCCGAITATSMTTSLQNGVIRDANSLQHALSQGGFTLAVQSAPLLVANDPAPPPGAEENGLIVVLAPLLAILVVIVLTLLWRRARRRAALPAAKTKPASASDSEQADSQTPFTLPPIPMPAAASMAEGVKPGLGAAAASMAGSKTTAERPVAAAAQVGESVPQAATPSPGLIEDVSDRIKKLLSPTTASPIPDRARCIQ